MVPPKCGQIILRIILIVVIVLVLVVAFVGHFGSEWTQPSRYGPILVLFRSGRDKYARRGYPLAYYGPGVEYKGKNFEVCNVYTDLAASPYWQRQQTLADIECPALGLERFYLAMLFLCLFGAVGSTLLVLFNKNDNKWLRLVDFILHVVLGFLLFIGMITFLVSTLQVQKYFDQQNEVVRKVNEHDRTDLKEYDWWYQWIIKLLASIFGLAVFALHGLIAFMIGKSLLQEIKQGRVVNVEENASQSQTESQSAMQTSQSSVYTQNQTV